MKRILNFLLILPLTVQLALAQSFLRQNPPEIIAERIRSLEAQVMPVVSSPELYASMKDDPVFKRKYTALQRLVRARTIGLRMLQCGEGQWNPFTEDSINTLQSETLIAYCDGSLDIRAFPENFNDFRDDLEAVYQVVHSEQGGGGFLRNEILGDLARKYLETISLMNEGAAFSKSQLRSRAQEDLCPNRGSCPMAAVIDSEVNKFSGQNSPALDADRVLRDLNSRVIPELNLSYTKTIRSLRSARLSHRHASRHEFSLAGHQAYADFEEEYNRLLAAGAGSLLAATSLSQDYGIGTMGEIAGYSISSPSDRFVITNHFKNVSSSDLSTALEGLKDSIGRRAKELAEAPSSEFYEEALQYYPRTLASMALEANISNFTGICDGIKELAENDPEQARAAAQRLYTILAVGGGVVGAAGGLLLAGPGGSVAGGIALSGAVASVLSIGAGYHNLQLRQDHQVASSAALVSTEGDQVAASVSEAWGEMSEAKNNLILDTLGLPLEILGLRAISKTDEVASLLSARNTRARSEVLTRAQQGGDLLSRTWRRLDDLLSVRGVSRVEDLKDVSDATMRRFLGEIGRLSPTEAENLFTNLQSTHSYDLKGFFWYLEYYKNDPQNFPRAIDYLKQPRTGLNSLEFSDSWWDQARLSYYEHMSFKYNNEAVTRNTVARDFPAKKTAARFSAYPSESGPQLSGDFSAAFKNESGHSYMIVGDAQGHGQQAARLSSMVTEIVHTDPTIVRAIEQGADVDVIVARIHERLAETIELNDSADYVSLSVTRLEETADGVRARFWSVENNPIVIRTSEGRTQAQVIENDDSFVKLGFDTGGTPEFTVRELETPLQPGDRLVLDTDGVNETILDTQRYGRATGRPVDPEEITNLRAAPSEFDFEAQTFVETGPSNFKTLLEARSDYTGPDDVLNHVLAPLGEIDDDQILWVMEF